jgi:hypothetical protein
MAIAEFTQEGVSALQRFSTAELQRELGQRKGVTARFMTPSERGALKIGDKEVEIDGPCWVTLNID